MPVYEYKCDACGHHLERFQRMSAEPLSRCPECAADALRKLVSAASFRLRGTGWYETDFKKRPRGSEAKEGGAGADKAGTDQAKTDQAKTDQAKGGGAPAQGGGASAERGTGDRSKPAAPG